VPRKCSLEVIYEGLGRPMITSAAVLLEGVTTKAEESTISPFVFGGATFAVFLLLLLVVTRFNPDR